MDKKKVLIYGVFGGVAFALTSVLLNYMRHKTLDWIYLLGGAVWFFAAIAALYILDSSNTR